MSLHSTMATSKSTRLKKDLKCLVIGLDGVPFEYIDPLIANNHLPNLSKLINSGLRAPLQSVYPPMTPAAWSSFLTGKNPGKHGVFGWWEIDDKDKNQLITPVDSRSICGDSLWDILSSYKQRVGILNVPMTYPAVEVNGFIISGFDNPFDEISSEFNQTYPRDLSNRLHKNGFTYKIFEPMCANIHTKNDQMLMSLDTWIKMEKERTRAAKWLAKTFNPQFMIIVFHLADYFMHKAPRESVFVKRSLETLDYCIGELLKICNEEETTIFVISDHGSVELKKYIYLQNWLINEGLLKFKETIPDENLNLILKSITTKSCEHVTCFDIQSLANKLEINYKKSDQNLESVLTKEIKKIFPSCCVSDSNIDWDNTKVFTISSYGELFINLKNRQPKGIVENGYEYEGLVKYLIDKLKNLRDPVTDEIIMKKVIRKEDYYYGPQIDKAPDILCFLRDQTYYCMRYNQFMRPDTTLKALSNSSKIIVESITPVDDFIGDHTSTGIFIAAGKSLKKFGQLHSANITDLAPTILGLYGITAPQDMDGRALIDWFNFPLEKLNDHSSIKAKETQEQRKSDIEIQKLRLKLRNFGYKV